MKKINKLSIIIPAYKALSFLNENAEMWIQVSNLIGPKNIFLIEDSREESMKTFADENGWHYFSKDNGNWGSVINFVRKNILLETKYFCIVDADDEIDIKELKKLLSAINNTEEDLIWTNSKWVNWKNKNEVKIKSEFWIHSIYIKTDLLKCVPSLPEGVFFTDNHFLMSVEKAAESIKELKNICPYIYFYNVLGASNDNSNFSDQKFKSWMELANIFLFRKQYNLEKEKYLTANLNDEKPYLYSDFSYLRNVWDNCDSSETRKVIARKYKELKKSKTPSFTKRLVWSRLYTFFTFKWLKNNK